MEEARSFADLFAARLLEEGWLPAESQIPALRVLERGSAMVGLCAPEELTVALIQGHLSQKLPARGATLVYLVAGQMFEPELEAFFQEHAKTPSRVALLAFNLSDQRLLRASTRTSVLARLVKTVAKAKEPPTVDFSTLADLAQSEYREWESHHPPTRPWGTWALLALCLGLFGWTVKESHGGESALFAGYPAWLLYRMGGCYAPAVWLGQWWRLFSAAFVHFGLGHLLVNMTLLWLYGPRLERYLGRWRYLSLVCVSALGGSLMACLLGPPRVGVGFSGVLCGFFGAGLWLGSKKSPLPPRVRFELGHSMLLMMGFTLLYGWVTPGVDNFAHLGGWLAAGAMAVALTRTNWRPLLVGLSLLPLVAEGFVATRLLRAPSVQAELAGPTWTWREPNGRFSLQWPALMVPTGSSKDYVVGPGLLAKASSYPLAVEFFSGPVNVTALRDLLLQDWSRRGLRLEDAKVVKVGERDWLVGVCKLPAKPEIATVAFTVEGDSLIEVSLTSSNAGPAFMDTVLELAATLDPAPTPMNRGIAALGRKDYAAAVEEFTRVLAEQPDRTVALASRAMAYLHLKQSEQALPDLNRWIELHPTFQAYLLRVDLEVRQGLSDAAVADAEKAVALNAPVAAALWFQLGLSLEARHEKAQALRCYERSLAAPADEKTRQQTRQRLEALKVSPK